jgi:large subunit ribosomal protein L11
MDFCQQFNDQTKTLTGAVPVVVTVYEDRSFSFIIKTAPVSELVKQTLKISSGAAHQLKDTAEPLLQDQLRRNC